MISLSNSKKSFNDYCELYIGKGYKIIPVEFQGKKPKHGVVKYGESWTDTVISESSQIKDYFADQSNIGIRLGEISGYLTDIDLDCPEAVGVAKFFFKDSSSFGRKGAGITHYMFKCAGSKTLKFTDPKNGETILEIRSDGAQTVVPPSVHTSGELIEWHNEIDPQEIEWEDLLRKVKKVAGFSLLAKHWQEGKRQDSAMALAGWLLRSGKNEKEIHYYLKIVATIAGDEESESRVSVIDHTFERYENGEKIYGFTKCSEIFGDEVMKKVSEWLGLRSDGDALIKARRDRVADKVSGALSKGMGGPLIMDNKVLMQDIANMKSNDLAGFELVRNLLRGKVNFNNFDAALKDYKIDIEDSHEPLSLEDTGGKPSLLLTERDLTTQREFCWAVIEEQKNPKIFLSGGNLSRIKFENGTAVEIEPFNEHSLATELSELIYFYDFRGKEAMQSYPPSLLIKAMLNENNPPVPTLNKITMNPNFSSGGQLLSSKGYHGVAKLWLDRDFDTSSIPCSPTKEDVFKARDYLLTELFNDFPFNDPCGKAYMFSAMLQNFVRGMISGPTPLYLVDAISREGTGKSLLSGVIAYIGTGKTPNFMASTRDEDEVRKRITTNLMAGSDVIIVDNISKKWDSTAFATALTSNIWQDRVLGGNSTARCKIDCLWLGNGNGVEPSRELARRVVLTMLDAKTSMPWTRDVEKFRHPELMSWVEKNIDSLVSACITIIMGWVSAGSPKSSKTLGSYEQWAKVMGGILEYAEVPGFLENLEMVYENMDQFTMSWVEFLPIWWQKHGFDPVGVSELWTLADDQSMLLEILGDGSDRSQKTKLGSALRDMNGRYLGEWKVEESTGQGKGGTKQYTLTGGDEAHIFREIKRDHAGTSDELFAEFDSKYS